MSLYIDIDNEIYPEILKNINNPPKRLYYKGNLELLKEAAIAVVGSRNITDYGRKHEQKLVRELALRDIVIISGMAKGADRIAHEETLNVKGKTIAVMGAGFNNIFPEENVDIYKRIIKEGGLILTEYEDNKKPLAKNFPERNRIVTGLSKAVLVIEAAYRSGTSITAGLAWEQGKNVYALPGRLDCKNGIGVNKLIQKGAKLVTSSKDIINDFEEFLLRRKRIVIQNNQVKKEYRKIYYLLSDIPISLEEITLKTQNSIRCSANLLTLMELEDLVEQIPGAGYVRKK